MREFLGYAALGIVILLVTMPRFLTWIISVNVRNEAIRSALESPISAAQSLSNLVVGPNPTDFFGRAMGASRSGCTKARR